MKRSRLELENKARVMTEDLFMWAGLKNAKKIVTMIRKNLKVESDRRKNLEKKE